MSEYGPWPTLPLGEIAAEMCLGKMLDKQKNGGTSSPIYGTSTSDGFRLTSTT